MPVIVTTSSDTSATGASIVKRAIRLLGEGTSPSDDEYTDGIEALNAMVAEWRNQGLMCFALQDEQFSLSASKGIYTVGLNGDFNTNRPVEIEGCYVVVSGVSYPVKVLETAQQYASIKVKGQTGDWPLKVYYDPSHPLGALACWPVPNQTVEIHILTRTPVLAFSLADTIDLPPGTTRALAFNLAIELASEYETDPRQSVIQGARNSKRALRKMNTVPVVAKSIFAGMKMGRRPNILADGE